MKSLAVMFCLVVMATCLAACGNKEQTEGTASSREVVEIPELDLANMTDRSIKEIYISVSNMEDWGENLMGNRKVFNRGTEITIDADTFQQNEMYDIKCVDNRGNEMLFTELNLYTLSRIILTVDENGITHAAVEEREGYQITGAEEETTQEETSEEESEE